MRITCLIVSCFIFFSLNSKEKNLRIHQYIPKKGNSFTFAVDPALPDDFICYSQDGILSHEGTLIWGKKETIDQFLTNPKEISDPLILVSISPNVFQKTYGKLIEIKSQDILQYTKDFEIERGTFGDYPYCKTWVKSNDKIYHCAHIGLNHESHAVLFLQLLQPEDGSKTKQAELLWNAFFKNTKQLPFPDFALAHGHDMQTGFTTVEIQDKKFKVTAEKRKKDGKIKLSVIPLDQDLIFNHINTYVDMMRTDWHKGELILKTLGTFIDQKNSIYMNMTVAILVKEVEEFSSSLLVNAFQELI